MEIIITENYEEMSRKAADLAARAVAQSPQGLISFPAGDTPVGMVDNFVEMANAGQVDVSAARYVSLDEWVGLGGEDAGSCRKFNLDHLVGPLQKPFKDVWLIDGKAADPAAERMALQSYLEQHGPLALSVLGVGLNGHLGFNEDGVDFEQDTILIPLAPTTLKVMHKYFDESVNPTQGLSIGIRQLMRAGKIILIANGEKKADIIAKTVNGPVTNSVPASVLQNHPNCTLVLDKAAAAKL